MTRAAIRSRRRITLSGAIVFATVTTGTLTLSGAIGGADGLQVNGSGAGGVTLTANSNTYTGTTTVAAGTLALNSGGLNTAVTDPTIVVGVSGGSAATLKLLQSFEIGDSTDVQIASSGTFDVNSFNESVRGLATTDGAVAIGTGSLSVSGPLSMTGGAITGTSPGVLRLLADVSATSSATAARHDLGARGPQRRPHLHGRGWPAAGRPEHRQQHRRRCVRLIADEGRRRHDVDHRHHRQHLHR